MAPRRSGRLREPSDQNTLDDAQEAPEQAETGTKRKHPTEKKPVTTAAGSKRAKKRTTEVKVPGIAKKTGASTTKNSGKLPSLSLEILDMIADNITDKPTMNAFSRTSKRFYQLMTPRLYSRVAVAAMFHAHIPKLIRTLEPHLTIKQRKQLKKEGKYKGQQDKFPSNLDENKVPLCASYVRQLVIGASDPGKKHKYIVERYYEEVLKNLVNLEIVETIVANKSICESIASLANLKALSILAYSAESGDVAPLTGIQNLKHLNLELGHDALATGQSMIRNSMSTLQTLNVIAHSAYSHCFENWGQSLASSGRDIASRVDNGPDLPALRSLHIEGMMIDQEFIEEFPRAIGFCQLREITFGSLKDSENLLWPSLTDLITSYKRSNTPLNLRTLSIDLDDRHQQDESEDQSAHFAAKCAFIASFDTLTTLKLPEYGQYRISAGLENPGLSDTLLQAILKHKNLRVLRINYTGVISGLEIPYLGAKPVGDIVDGLPYLREFEFAPDEQHMDEISQALCRGKSLEVVTCFPHESWVSYTYPDPRGTNILSSFLSTFMSNATADVGSNRFVWEDHYKVNCLSLSYTKWNIASRFGKPKKGYGKPEKFTIDVEDGTREVWHQSVPRTQYIHVGYDPLFEWVTKVEKEL